MKMKSKSTLEKEHDKLRADAKLLKESGMKVPPLVLEVNELVKNSPKFLYTFDQAIKTAKTIRPSIGKEDLRIATVLQLTLCSQLIYNLIDANLIKIVK